MGDQLPAFLGWLFSTPWYVPGFLAAALTGWVMWITRPATSLVAPSPEPQPRLADISRSPAPVSQTLPLQAETVEIKTDPSPSFNPKGLHVGFMQIDARDVGEEGVIQIVAFCFNATGYPLDLFQVNGAIRVEEAVAGNRTDLGLLPRPWFSEANTPLVNIPGFIEFPLFLEQPVPPAIAERFTKLEGAHTLSLLLSDLEVMVAAHDAPHHKIRVPLWGGIVAHRDGQKMQFGRISIGRMAPMTLSLGAAKV